MGHYVHLNRGVSGSLRHRFNELGEPLGVVGAALAPVV
jgi:hypothetical protein